MKNSFNVIKLSLITLLFLCVFKMPYGYYQLVRFLALLGFGVLAYRSNEVKDQIGLIIFGGLALLFQPFFKVALGREVWVVVDIIVGSGLVINLIVNRIKRKE
mgnify:CR=1 FL=1